MADEERNKNALRCKGCVDPSNELENTQWYGFNTYVQSEDILDFKLLRDASRATTSSLSFHCFSPTFPTTKAHVIAMSPEYSLQNTVHLYELHLYHQRLHATTLDGVRKAILVKDNTVRLHV
ncbi:hypothetical protein P3T76_006413 [Phytophthora citrophthora]|uniref:Uncharacterized protein n=1 Tax=Phytophthora citrophthora TaxID=4793 RepID=A0AAD9GQ52_9STRA|nr:hypothetical protein P3T76_006413 [Phytophthora citrophthora]